MTLTPEQKRHLLSKIDRLVQEKFYDPNFNGHDWHLLVSKYRERIVNSPNTEAFEYGVTDLLSELHSSGTGLLGRHTKITPRNSIAASFRSIIDTPDRREMGLRGLRSILGKSVRMARGWRGTSFSFRRPSLCLLSRASSLQEMREKYN